MKRKLIVLLVFIILFSFVMSPFCLALSITLDGVDYNIVETDKVKIYDYVVVINWNNTSFMIYTSTTPFEILEDSLPYFITNTPGSYCQFLLNKKTSATTFLQGRSDVTETRIVNFGGVPDFFWSNFDIKDKDGNLIFGNSSIVKPYFENKNVLSTGKFDKIIIKSGDYNHHSQQEFYLFTYYYSNMVDDNLGGLYSRKRILLDGTLNQYFVGADSNGYYTYEVPLSVTGIDLVEGNEYGFKLALMEYNDSLGYDVVSEYTDAIDFSIGAITTEEKEQADRDKQLAITESLLEKQEEQNKTNKGIWDTLKEILNFINPLSENFFVYKLVSLLIEAVKSLFLPSQGYFEEYITDMNDWFSERLGILYYPVDLVVTFLEKIGQISESGSAIIHWGNFNFMGAELIQSGSYDLNALIDSNETLTNIHSIYLVFTDVILWLGLCVLAKNTFVDIFGGKYDEIGDYVVGGAEIGIDYDKQKLAYNKSKLRKERGRIR